jgi:6-phosphogluconolactonase/glucosamine-6-phosphate isomerase/deaminase
VAVEFVTYETEQRAADALFNELRHYLGFGPGYHSSDPQDDRTTAEKTATAPYVIMLAGGSTPLEVYRNVAKHPPRHIHPAAHLILSDDRYVPETDERSNFGAIRPLATGLGLKENRFVHADTSLPVEETVADFGRQVVGLGERSALFALGVLGIGPDGHTASLFTTSMVQLPRPDGTNGTGGGTLLVTAPERAAVATGVHGGVPRISLGAEVLLSFRKLIFFAPGLAKREILYEISRRPEEYPAGLIMLNHPNAHIWTDEGPRVE